VIRTPRVSTRLKIHFHPGAPGLWVLPMRNVRVGRCKLLPGLPSHRGQRKIVVGWVICEREPRQPRVRCGFATRREISSLPFSRRSTQAVRSSVFSQCPGSACSSQRPCRTTACRGRGPAVAAMAVAARTAGRRRRRRSWRVRWVGGAQRRRRRHNDGSGSHVGASALLPRAASEISLNPALIARFE